MNQIVMMIKQAAHHFKLGQFTSAKLLAHRIHAEIKNITGSMAVRIQVLVNKIKRGGYVL